MLLLLLQNLSCFLTVFTVKVKSLQWLEKCPPSGTHIPTVWPQFLNSPVAESAAVILASFLFHKTPAYSYLRVFALLVASAWEIFVPDKQELPSYVLQVCSSMSHSVGSRCDHPI